MTAVSTAMSSRKLDPSHPFLPLIGHEIPPLGGRDNVGDIEEIRNEGLTLRHRWVIARS